MLKKTMTTFTRITLCFIFAFNANSENIVINKVNDARAELIKDVLTLAFAKSSPNIKLAELPEKMPFSRLKQEMDMGNVDVIWGSSGKTIENELMPIRIPILKGLLGYRIFIIRTDAQDRFNGVNNLAQLQQLSAGQASYWGDTKVLKRAGLAVVTSLKYKNLIHMLEGGRFDYFPRGIHEIHSEVDNQTELDVAMEKRLLLVYPYAMYFYVHKQNKALYDKLNRGFELAIADGSYDALFFNNALIKDALYNTNLQRRTVIRIENPNMHVKTPFDRAELWLNIDEL